MQDRLHPCPLQHPSLQCYLHKRQNTPGIFALFLDALLSSPRRLRIRLTVARLLKDQKQKDYSSSTYEATSRGVSPFMSLLSTLAPAATNADNSATLVLERNSPYSAFRLFISTTDASILLRSRYHLQHVQHTLEVRARILSPEEKFRTMLHAKEHIG